MSDSPHENETSRARVPAEFLYSLTTRKPVPKRHELARYGWSNEVVDGLLALLEHLLDALTQLVGHRHAPQLFPDCLENALLERVFARAGSAGLEMGVDARELTRGELAIDVFVHPAKRFFAGIAIQRRHDVN